MELGMYRESSPQASGARAPDACGEDGSVDSKNLKDTP